MLVLAMASVIACNGGKEVTENVEFSETYSCVEVSINNDTLMIIISDPQFVGEKDGKLRIENQFGSIRLPKGCSIVNLVDTTFVFERLPLPEAPPCQNGRCRIE